MNSIQKKITKTLGMENLPPEELQEMIMRIGTVIYQNVLMRVMETMKEKDQNEFEELLDKDADPEKIFSFLKEKVRNFEEIIEEEAIKFKNKSSKIMDQIG